MKKKNFKVYFQLINYIIIYNNKRKWIYNSMENTISVRSLEQEHLEKYILSLR